MALVPVSASAELASVRLMSAIAASLRTLDAIIVRPSFGDPSCRREARDAPCAPCACRRLPPPAKARAVLTPLSTLLRSVRREPHVGDGAAAASRIIGPA